MRGPRPTRGEHTKTSVLNSCTAQGVDASVITNSYDLEIDKQCLIYERNLTESNDQMTSTVRNAKAVLQKARLLVAQQKNSYDLRGCINALDSCMQDDFVCGSDYENCLDPSGKYIVNGAIVQGSTPGYTVSGSTISSSSEYPKDQLFSTWNYDSNKNAWSGDGSLMDYIDKTVTSSPVTKTSVNMSQYLQYKIGYNDGSKNFGMCMSVLNKCQDITYTGTGQNLKYNPANNVIKEYLARVLPQLKTAQDTLLASYAEKCISDVQTCLNTNNYPDNPTTNTKQANIAINACRSQIITCMSVNGDTTASPTPDAMAKWTKNVFYDEQPSDYTTSATCIAAGYKWNGSKCIANTTSVSPVSGGTAVLP